jgi:hypothetical protein
LFVDDYGEVWEFGGIDLEIGRRSQSRGSQGTQQRNAEDAEMR